MKAYSKTMLEQAATDYDVEIETVVRISRQYNKYSDFYKKLEEMLEAAES